MTLILDPTTPGGNGAEPTPGHPPSFDRGPLRHVILGKLSHLRATQVNLHTRRYADLNLWTPPMPIPPSGLIIPYLPDEYFIFLQRPEHLP